MRVRGGALFVRGAQEKLTGRLESRRERTLREFPEGGESIKPKVRLGNRPAERRNRQAGQSRLTGAPEGSRARGEHKFHRRLADAMAPAGRFDYLAHRTMTDHRTANADVIVIGGGLVGSAIAYGLTRHASRVILLDEGDQAFRAARGNFGLVWVQSKGDGAPHYTRWSRMSAERWPGLAAELLEATGVDTHHERNGGFTLCLSEAEFLDRRAMMERHHRDAGNDGFEYEMVAGAELRRRLPAVGHAVYGASFTPYDGTANPLFTLHALQAAFAARGGVYRPGRTVGRIAYEGGTFRVGTGMEELGAPRIVIAAGNGTPRLAEMVGLHIPLHPERGQILVTERVAPFLDLPTQNLRQTAEGSLLMGDSREDVGFDTATTAAAITDIAARAVASFPILRDIQVVRAWGALRVLSPDGLPIYAESESCPGAFVAACHSGVTLAAVHARELGGWIMGADKPAAIAKLHPGRFDVQAPRT